MEDLVEKLFGPKSNCDQNSKVDEIMELNLDVVSEIQGNYNVLYEAPLNSTSIPVVDYNLPKIDLKKNCQNEVPITYIECHQSKVRF